MSNVSTAGMGESCVFSICQVLKMQSKWILQTLMRIFSTQNYDQMAGSLKAFLPRSLTPDHFKEIVLSPRLSGVLEQCHFMAHFAELEQVEDSQMDHMEAVLGCVSSNLTCKVLQQYHRTISRISSLTMFKRFLNESHKLVVAKKLDEEAGSKAKMVEEIMAKLLAIDFSNAGSFDFEKLLEVLQDRVAEYSGEEEVPTRYRK